MVGCKPAPAHAGSTAQKQQPPTFEDAFNPSKRLETGKKVGGRKSHAELSPETVMLAKRLRRANPKTGRRLSFREISVKLEEAGHLNERGQPFNPQSVRAMIAGPQPRASRGTVENSG